MIVLDASAALELVLVTDAGQTVARLLERNGDSLHAPHLIDLEVLQVLRRIVRSGQLPVSRAREAIDDFVDLRIERYGHLGLTRRIWELRENASAYDAAYLALAEALGASLVTCDKALARVPGLRAQVRVC